MKTITEVPATTSPAHTPGQMKFQKDDRSPTYSVARWEDRSYERGSMLSYKGKGGRYRFNGRFLSGYPKDLQVYDDDTGWSPCSNVNIGIRIQHEDELFPECVKGNHDWSRFTTSQWNCKRCGIINGHI